MSRNEPHDPMAMLWRQFQPNAQHRLDRLQAWLHGEEDHTIAMQEAHKLAGALGSYGRPNGSTAAAAVEDRLRDHLAGYGSDPRRGPDVAELLEQIRQEIT